MTDRESAIKDANVSGAMSRWTQCGILVGVCALVIALYAYLAESGFLELTSSNPSDSYYNLLVQGFRAGQLSLKKEVPPGLAQLADPYDPTANAPYLTAPHTLLDMSYYKGKLYLYWGVTPAVILFWPYVALTGHYLLHKHAVVIFCTVGFLASVVLLRALWWRYFAATSMWVVAACALALALATGVPWILSRAEVYEVPVSCAYMLTMLALVALWGALYRGERGCRWLAVASGLYGLALGARPSLLFGAVILLVPVSQAWRERRRVWAPLMAAAAPIALIGLSLMLYNALRFDSVFEFGTRYQLAPVPQEKFFGLRFLWFNLRVYFLEPARWTTQLPFVREIAVPPPPSGYAGLQTPFGVLTNVPLVWVVLAAPLAWHGRSAKDQSSLRLFSFATVMLVGTSVFTLGLFHASSIRYEVEFLPALVLLAVVGVLGLERTLANRSRYARTLARWGWGMLLSFSLVFNVCVCIPNHAVAHFYKGNNLLLTDRVEDAVKHFETALRLKPDYAQAYNGLGFARARTGRLDEAMAHYEQAIRINPDYALAYCSLANLQALTGRKQQAIEHWLRALQIDPEFAEAHNNLATALCESGKLEDAIAHWKAAVRIKPDYVPAHYNLGVTLEEAGMIQEAIGHYEHALRIMPDSVAIQNDLRRLRAGQQPAVPRSETDETSDGTN